MITLKLKQLFSGQFIGAMRQVGNASGLPVKIAYSAGKIADKAQQELKKGQAAWRALIQEYGVKGIDGELKREESDPNAFEIQAEKKDEFEKKVNELMEQEVKLPFGKLQLDSLDPVGLTPNQVIAIEPILHFLEEVPSEDQAAGA